jgi:hypothetical protein
LREILSVRINQCKHSDIERSSLISVYYRKKHLKQKDLRSALRTLKESNNEFLFEDCFLQDFILDLSKCQYQMGLKTRQPCRIRADVVGHAVNKALKRLGRPETTITEVEIMRRLPRT